MLLQVKVLIVEDDPMVARLNELAVRSVPGFQLAGICRTSAAAFASVAERRPDLLLLDVYMPGETGLDLMRQLRQGKCPVDIILITAADDADTVTQAMRFGACDYLIKPFEVARLQEALVRYRERLERVGREGSLDQAAVDALLGGTSVGGKRPLPKGIDAATLRRVQGLIEQAGGSVTAQDLGQALGASRVTALRYLQYLVGEGAVKGSPSYGAKGRPTILYSRVR